MRRDELTARGVQLPVLPTVVLGALPDGPDWPAILTRIGIDVISSGVATDTPATIEAAHAAMPFRPLIGRGGDPDRLAGAGATLWEGPAGADAPLYGIGPDDLIVRPVAADDPEMEAVMEAARTVLRAAQAGVPSALWVAVGPGLDALEPDVVEAKLAVVVDAARQARMYLAKEQFDTANRG